MLRLRSAAIVLGLLIPVATLAAPPPPVTGLSGLQEANGEVRIEWQPSTDSSVVRYRLYYSSESILESQGVYDDFEETQGMENVYVFVSPPTTGSLYVTVLAVNNMGEESDAFVEEVKVDLTTSAGTPRLETASSSSAAPWAADPQPQPEPPVLTLPESSSSEAQSSSAQASIPTYAEPAKDGRLHLLLAEALSPIQVKLTFSDPVQIDQQAAPQAFMILGPGGTPLAITKLLLSDQIVVLDTAQQQKGLVYNVKLSEPLQGINGEPLDATDRTAFFTGHDQGLDPAAAVAPVQPVIPTYDPMHPADVMGFALRATPDAGGTYTVTALWQADVSRGDIAHYIVKQSLDGGRTFGQPQTIPMDVAGVEFTGVQPGMFGISLQVMNVYGGTSAGIFDSVTLGNGAVPPPLAVQGSTTSMGWQGVPGPDMAAMLANVDAMARAQQIARTRSRSHLPDSGLGLFAVGSSLIGACAGWRKAKKVTV